MKKLFLPVLTIFLASCATSPEITAWNMAKEVNTPAAYQDFTRRYPSSGHAGEAREKLGKAESDRIMQAATVSECIGLMKGNIDQQTAATVADLAFKAAQKENSVEALYNYLEYFKNHSGAPAVRAQLEELEFENARKDASPVAMEYFLYRYPGSRFETEGRNILRAGYLKQVKEWGNQYGFRAFLVRFPESDNAAELKGLVRMTAPRSGLPDLKVAFAEAVTKSPALRKQACVLALSAAIKGHTGDLDTMRHQLRVIEKSTGSDELTSAICASAGLRVKSGSEDGLADALDVLSVLENQRKELAAGWALCQKRDDIAKAAVIASTQVVNDLETAELSEEVLGTGPLGSMTTGPEKGSQSAKKAFERFSEVQAVIRKDKTDIKRMLVEIDGLYKPLQAYVSGCVEAK